MENFIKKEKKQKKNVKKIDYQNFRVLTPEEVRTMSTQIDKLEDHERLQLYHFIKMDDIPHTKQTNGILLNSVDANDEFLFKIYKFINQCIENQKYRIIN